MALKIVVGGWCLVALVLVNSYSGKLISALIVPKLEPVVNSFEELANSKTLKVTVESNSVLSDIIMVSDRHLLECGKVSLEFVSACSRLANNLLLYHVSAK